MCCATVYLLMFRFAAIWILVHPLAARCKTLSSLCVKRAKPATASVPMYTFHPLKACPY